MDHELALNELLAYQTPIDYNGDYRVFEFELPYNNKIQIQAKLIGYNPVQYEIIDFKYIA